MAAIKDYSLQNTINNHKLIALTRSVDRWNLVGSWSATVGPMNDGTYNTGAFAPGSRIDFDDMQNALITGWSRGENGELIVEGQDAGTRLNRSCPPVYYLPEGDALALMKKLAGDCGVTLGGVANLSGFDARSLVTADRISEVIVELCQLSGVVPYVKADGSIELVQPVKREITLADVLQDNGRQLDLDGYAKGVTVVLYRRKKTGKESGGETAPDGPYYRGITPTSRIAQETFDGENIKTVVLQPLGAIKSVEIHTDETYELNDIPGQSVRIVSDVSEEYAYETSNGTYWQNMENDAPYNIYDTDREYRWFEWRTTGYTKQSVVKKYASGAGGIATQEATSETMTRVFDFSGRISREEYLGATARTAIDGGDLPPLEPGEPAYGPPYDERTVTTYRRTGFDDTLVIAEKRSVYEKQEVGQFPTITKLNGEKVTYAMGNEGIFFQVASRINSSIQWVERIIITTTIESMDDNGVVRTRSTQVYDDEGSAYKREKGWGKPPSSGKPLTPEEEVVERKQALYEWFNEGGTKITHDENLSAEPADAIMQRIDLEGRERYYGSSGGTNIDSGNWYDPSTGGCVPSSVCPHYSAGQCGIHSIDVIWDYTKEKCPYSNGRGWRTCPRALGALEQARSDDDQEQFEAPMICAAGDTNSGAQYTRKVYIRDFMEENQARVIGNRIASNLLAIKGARGVLQSVTIPLDTSLHQDGTITSVSHDYKAMKTTAEYRVDGDIPDILLPSSSSSYIFYGASRDRKREDRYAQGEVVEIDAQTGRVKVQVGNDIYTCSLRITQVGVGDQVYVQLTAGNNMDGIVDKRV